MYLLTCFFTYLFADLFAEDLNTLHTFFFVLCILDCFVILNHVDAYTSKTVILEEISHIFIAFNGLIVFHEIDKIHVFDTSFLEELFSSLENLFCF